MKKEKGITLIALVITIIIMLILVGATITILTEGAIIDKAQNAVIGTDTAQKNETNRMNEVGGEIEVTTRRLYIDPTPTLPIADESKSCSLGFENGDTLIATYDILTAGCPSILIAINGENVQVGEVFTSYIYAEPATEWTGDIPGGVTVTGVTLKPGWNKVQATKTSETEAGNVVSTQIEASELPILNYPGNPSGFNLTELELDVDNWELYLKSTPYSN